MLNQYLIFLPVLAQVLLTALVWLWLYKTRIAYMRDQKINPQKIAYQIDANQYMQAVAGPSENFINLFETPVLFYVACIIIFVTRTADQMMLILATVFVALRFLHSLIHISYNRVMHRFIAYMTSTLVLWVLWGLLGFELISRMELT